MHVLTCDLCYHHTTYKQSWQNEWLTSLHTIKVWKQHPAEQLPDVFVVFETNIRLVEWGFCILIWDFCSQSQLFVCLRPAGGAACAHTTSSAPIMSWLQVQLILQCALPKSHCIYHILCQSAIVWYKCESISSNIGLCNRAKYSIY